MPNDTLITWIDEDGKKAAKALHQRYRDIADIVDPKHVSLKDGFGGMLIVIGHGRTMCEMGFYHGIDAWLGQCRTPFIVLAACEVGEVHVGVGELQSIAQGLANRRDASVWGTMGNLPQDAVAQGTCFYKSPIYNWLQPANDNHPGLWKCFKKQSDEEQVGAMFSNLNINSFAP